MTQNSKTEQQEQQQGERVQGTAKQKMDNGGTTSQNGSRKKRQRFHQPRACYVAVDCTDRVPTAVKKTLRDAVCEKNFKLCQQLLKEGCDPNLTDENKSTVLHTLAKKYSKKETRAQKIPSILFEHGADINAQDNSGDTPLHIAAREGVRDLCVILVEHLKTRGQSSNVNNRNNKCMTPLHYAAQQGSCLVVKYLIGEGANPNLRDKEKYLPLHHAAERGYDACCDVLAQYYTEEVARNKETISPVILAAKNGHYRCYEKMGEAKVDLDSKDKDGNTALHIVAKSGFEKFVELLLRKGALPNVQNNYGNTPLMNAISRNKTCCVRVLKDNGADLGIKNRDRCGVLHLAASKKADECMELLLTCDEVKNNLDDVNKDENTALYIAVQKHDEKCSSLLLAAGASPRVASHKESLLHLATESLKTAMLEKLLATKQLDVNLINKDSQETPLHVAARKGSREACQMLLRKGARKEALESNGRTALHLSSYHGHACVVRLLIKNCAKIRVKDDKGKTPLHAAAAKGNLQCCEILTAADKVLYKEVDSKKRLAMDISILNGHHDVFAFLLHGLPFKDINKMPTELQGQIHYYSHKALKDKNRKLVEAIVESNWWEAGFVGNRKHDDGPCSNFRELLRLYPSLAKTVMDNCCHTLSEDVPRATLFDFRIFEDTYYIAEGESPFYSTTWNVHDNAVDLTPDNLEWKERHPVTKMVHHRQLALLQHPLTEAWLRHKWRSYARCIFTFQVLLQVFSVAVLIGFMTTVKNWKQIEQTLNCSVEEICQTALRNTTTVNGISENTLTRTLACREHEWNPVPSFVWHTLLALSVLMQFLNEFNRFWKLRMHNMDSIVVFVRVPCLLLTALLFLPDSYCGFKLGIKSIGIWACGVIALLMTSLHLLHTVNQLPQFSIFSAITKNFVKDYLKGLLFIGTVIFLFALIFHLLLEDLDAFQTWPQSFVKTVVWIMGDLGYDDTFLQKQLAYPILANVIFLVFVCTVGAFIVTLIKTPSSDGKEIALYRKATRVQLLLSLDVCFPWFKRGYAVGKYDNSKEKPWILTKVECLLLPRGAWVVHNLSSQFDKLALISFHRHKDNKSWVLSTCERILNVFRDSDEEVDQGLLDLTQNQLEVHTTKLDKLLELCTQLNDSYQKQNEQMLELKQQLESNYQRQNEQISELKQQLTNTKKLLPVL